MSRLATPNPNVTGHETALYIAWAADETPLYIGTTNKPRSRWRQHAKDKAWWPEVDYLDYKWFSYRSEAERTEQLLISQHCPIYNRAMPPWYCGLPQEDLRTWCDWFNDRAKLVFEVLEDGADLETVAEAAEWHPRYVVRLGRQRHIPWAMNYTGAYDDMPTEGYLWPGRDGKVKPS
ncbi:GIY-YIG nuclease family protein [Streptomyces sp. NPDC127091]|uniref:GIY-YIG nuclease family protein n=1 Tax=Streptomyces sp. NPDC127091 TaxID=3347134 RepID=UPI0036555EDE